MSSELRVCLFEDARSKSDSLAKAFAKVTEAKIAEVVGVWEALHACLIRGLVDVVAVDLDGPGGLDVVAKIARQQSEIPVIGISTQTAVPFIIQAMRAGCAQFVCAPIDPVDLRTALQRMKPARPKALPKSKRVCVVGSSGGAGATTVACNLSIELAQITERQIALVDMNLEYGDVCCAFDCHPKYTIADICADNSALDQDTLNATLHELPCGVSVLSRPENIEETRDITPEAVEQMFRMLAEHYTHVVVDMPRGFSFLTAVAGGRADCILIVAQLAVPFIRNATRIYQTLLQMGADEDRIQLVLNRSNADFERITIKDVEQHFRRPVFGIIPNDYQFVSASLDLGHPIGADAPTSRARAAIQEIAKKLAPEFVGAAAHGDQSSFFSKLLGRKQKA